MQKVPMDETPEAENKEDFFEQMKRIEEERASKGILIHEGWEYAPCEGGYCLDIFDWKLRGLDDEFLKYVNIPRELNGKPVVAISKDAFSYFGGFRLESLTIPDTVVDVNTRSIQVMSQKKKISLSVDPNNPKYSVIDGNLYSKNGKMLLCGIGKDGDGEIFVVPDGVSGIGDCALQRGKYAGVILPLSVRSIGKESLWDMKHTDSLKNIYFKGTKKEWNAILKATAVPCVYYYKEGKPSFFDKKTWRFAADGVTPEITKDK